jgi:conjugative relaxase-like TrwC/TraI family protein
MTVSIARMSLGGGYAYLLESVARGDGAGSMSSPLTRYYAESGTPPGRFMGAGLAGVNGGTGVAEGSEVSEEMLFNMLGTLSDPITGTPLGKNSIRWPASLTQRVLSRIDALDPGLSDRERAQRAVTIKSEELARTKNIARPVAGFDLTFSLPKSVSAAWAVADAGTQAIIYDAHQDAIRRTIAYAETHTFFSRSGTNGVVQEEIRGVVAAAFDHWDSRAGDPHLHTHVVIQNRVQTRDGKWRTLDSRGLFKQVVTLSELHQGIVMDLLADTLGWGFDPRARTHSDVARWDVTGVSEGLLAEFSQRSQQIAAAKDAAIAAFTERMGRTPTAVEILRIRQHTTLTTRPDKHHHSLAEQTERWRDRAQPHLPDGTDPGSWVASLAGRSDVPPLRADDLDDLILRSDGAAVVEIVAGKRATFGRANVLAEVHRQLHSVRFASPDDRIAVAERTADLALAGSLRLSAPSLHLVPDPFTREDGTSRFTGRGAALYTTQGLLDAEDRLLTVSRLTGGPQVDRGIVAAVAAADLSGKDYRMSLDQALAAESICTSGRVVDVLVGPAGTGKSTTMGGVRAMHERQYGPGSVIGLAPSAAAAEVLGAELGIATENTAMWLTQQRLQPARLEEIAELQAVRYTPAQARVHLNALQQRIAALRAGGQTEAADELDRERFQYLPYLSPRARQARITKVAEDFRARALKPGQLVIVDEASLIGTFTLDSLVDQARLAGAKVLLVGDWAQLSAVDAGGAFAMLVHDRDVVPELTDVRRFVNRWEKAASISLRVGDVTALDVYDEQDRIAHGTRDDMIEGVYAGWKADIEAGKTSLMIAGDGETVAELNRRARADRVAAGQVTEAGLAVTGGVAGVGDRVVTRLNNRRLTTGKRWVKNGDLWTVTRVNKDGSMAVTREGGRRRRGAGTVVLPADYVQHRVELGYATTAHRAQGRTVDTAHALVSASTTREVLYVAWTRGRESNRVYVDAFPDPTRDTSHGPVVEQPYRDVLAGVLANAGADTSAHTVIGRELDQAAAISTLAAEYLTIARHAQAERWGRLIDTCGLTATQAEEVRESESFGPLIAALRDAEARDLDVGRFFPQLVTGRELDTADDIAAALHDRLDRWVTASASPRAGATKFAAGIIPLAQHVSDEDMARALAEREAALNARARQLAEAAIGRDAAWVRALGPPPTDPARREAWVTEVATIAAYRERWSVHSSDPVDAQSRGVERIGHEKRATAAAARAGVLANPTRSGASVTAATRSAAPSSPENDVQL